ncbi:hypothetical protein [Mucilaginibacter boryungensis]|uniref:Uncharacterized protein n=1 Tax=Mucilaginibacter boryungensis TaxID=768480 RepID=A0ABR9XC15_9SPHI|nr:hypothetical protein [Mucilaginibacter boryungensis]MBE9664902.1 hypothetical protein [Mucilaginibacter boryungensis]
MDNAPLIEAKVNELVELLRKNPPNIEQAIQIKGKINEALDNASVPKSLEAFRELDTVTNRLELMDDLELLLSQHQLDNTTAKKYLIQEKINKGLIIIIGIVMMLLGLGMIIMPAPPNFEMFTLFYFNPNDGVTIMDVLSLLIVLTGIYLFANAIMKKPKS